MSDEERSKKMIEEIHQYCMCPKPVMTHKILEKNFRDVRAEEQEACAEELMKMAALISDNQDATDLLAAACELIRVRGKK
jgi:hypothetical protein